MQSNKLVKIISFILCLGFVFCTLGSTAYAESTSALKEKKAKIQQQIDEAEKKIAGLKEKKEETQEYITALDKKIKLKQDQIDVLQADADELQSEIDKVQADINKTEAKIEKTQAEIDAKQAEFDKTYAEYCQRLRAMYISGSASSIEVLLTCEDISSILTRSQMIKSVSENDSAVLDSLMTQMRLLDLQLLTIRIQLLQFLRNSHTILYQV